MPTSRAPRRASARTQPPRAPDHVTRAYDELRRFIIGGQLSPGGRISERAVGERLGLSRTPVRSALHRLEQEGFIVSEGSGRERRLIVAPLTMHDGQELFTIVGHLEGMAARLAALLPAAQRRAVVARLRTVNRELEAQARTGGDAERFFALDFEFHRTYVEEVVGPRLRALHHAFKPQTERYVRLYTTVFLGQVVTSVREHDRIVAAIARGDAEAAQREAETNWYNAAARLARVIEQHGERGIWQALRPEAPPGAAAGGKAAPSRRRPAARQRAG